MLAKILVIVAMIVILGSLVSGLIFLVKDDGKSQRLVKALTVRIGLSLSLFLLMIVAFALGWIHPHTLS